MRLTMSMGRTITLMRTRIITITIIRTTTIMRTIITAIIITITTTGMDRAAKGSITAPGLRASMFPA